MSEFRGKDISPTDRFLDNSLLENYPTYKHWSSNTVFPKFWSSERKEFLKWVHYLVTGTNKLYRVKLWTNIIINNKQYYSLRKGYFLSSLDRTWTFPIKNWQVSISYFSTYSVNTKYIFLKPLVNDWIDVYRNQTLFDPKARSSPSFPPTSTHTPNISSIHVETLDLNIF